MRPIDADLAPIFLNEQGCKMIKKMPTIDYKDLVPRGEWKFGKNHGEFVEATCTACNGILLVKWYDELSHFRFCPNCGARMKGGLSDGLCTKD